MPVDLRGDWYNAGFDVNWLDQCLPLLQANLSTGNYQTAQLYLHAAINPAIGAALNAGLTPTEPVHNPP
jgi:hypothetical protein